MRWIQIDIFVGTSGPLAELRVEHPHYQCRLIIHDAGSLLVPQYRYRVFPCDYIIIMVVVIIMTKVG
jgi:hypothetical protein